MRRHETACPPAGADAAGRPSRRPPPTAASPGSAGLGDRLNPGIGNGGYDVLHYDLDLRYATSAPAQSIDGTVTILARATQSLSRFNLDFGGRQRRLGVGRRPFGRVAGAKARSSSSRRAGRCAGTRGSSCASRTSSPRRPRPATSRSRARSSSHADRLRHRAAALLRPPHLPVQRPPARQGDASRSGSTSRPASVAVANGLPLGHWTSRRPHDLGATSSASRWRPS